jgi:hypothetical protein
VRRFLSIVEIAYPLGRDVTALRLLDGRVVTAPSTWRLTLDGCKGAKTFDDHAAAIDAQTVNAAADRSDVRGALRGLIDAGALADYEELRLRASAVGDGDERRAHVATLVVPTCGRPDALERCIASFATNAREYGRDIEVVVGDDARDAGERESLRERLARVSRRDRVPIRYAGAEEKKRFVEELIRASGVPHEIAAFALLGADDGAERMGANRNALLLDVVGEACVSVDDDTVCLVAAHPERLDHLRLVGETDPTEFWFFAERDDALSTVRFEPADFFGLHEALLGRPLCDLLRDPKSDVTDAGHYLARDLLRGGTHVAVTYNGVVGDSGMYSGANLLHTRGATRERLTQERSAYDLAFRSREVLRVVQAPTVCRGLPFMGTFFGLDARQPLPPFLPTRRNEDGVFGYALIKCFGEACMGHVPMAAVHDPSGRRSYMPDRLAEIETFRVSDLIIQCILNTRLSDASLSWDAALEAVGSDIARAADLPKAAFDRFLRDRLCAYASARTAYYHRLLDTFRAQPRFWAEDVVARIRRLQRCLSTDGYFTPADVGGSDVTARRELTRRLVGLWGNMMTYWPAILSTARSLKASGHRVSRSL